MENNQEWISVNDLAKKVDVSENTLKRYIRRHEQFLTVKQGNRSKYFIHSDSVKIIKQIKKLYNDNMNEEEVNKKLQTSGVPLIITVSTDNNGVEPLSMNILDTMNALYERLGQLEQINKNQSEQLEELKELVKQQAKQQKQQQDFQKAVIQRMDERDQNLMAMIRKNQETKKLIATTQQKKWWQFWK
ncbi:MULTISPECIES: DUF3967 domain-containing protein [unclassified Bacillus (in: firmicutes)]|uniref:DUF3967 domain-containing protein n=1 Tax=unclassified Bacillus (in: firmicutes) TaxID=185979 RepID=UPI0020C6E3AC|nr:MULTISPECIES: DUF3967 domain-containing protein [unclassified Bacillus (in: firmicutes)]